MALLRDYDVSVDVEPNAFSCAEDDELFELESYEMWDEDETACPYDAGHFVAPVFVTDAVPAGVPADIAADFWHHGRKRYEFTLDLD